MKTPRQPSPTAYETLRATPVRSLRYPLTLRVHDWVAGRRDGRIDLNRIDATARDAVAELTTRTSVWLEHNEHHELERHRHEHLAHQARTVQLQIRHDTVIADLETAHAELGAATAALEAVSPLTSAELAQRGAAESRTPSAVVAARRSREHEAGNLAPARQRAAGAAHACAALTGELHALAAQLDALAEVTATRQERITELHARRSSVYRRAYLRAVRRAERRAERQAARRLRRPARAPRLAVVRRPEG